MTYEWISETCANNFLIHCWSQKPSQVMDWHLGQAENFDKNFVISFQFKNLSKFLFQSLQIKFSEYFYTTYVRFKIHYFSF